MLVGGGGGGSLLLKAGNLCCLTPSHVGGEARPRPLINQHLHPLYCGRGEERGERKYGCTKEKLEERHKFHLLLYLSVPDRCVHEQCFRGFLSPKVSMRSCCYYQPSGASGHIGLGWLSWGLKKTRGLIIPLKMCKHTGYFVQWQCIMTSKILLCCLHLQDTSATIFSFAFQVI